MTDLPLFPDLRLTKYQEHRILGLIDAMRKELEEYRKAYSQAYHALVLAHTGLRIIEQSRDFPAGQKRTAEGHLRALRGNFPELMKEIEG